MTKQEHISNTYQNEIPRLTGFIRKDVSSQQDAEDIAQDVFVSLTEGFDDLRSISSTISWIYSVARKKIIDFKRKKKPSALEDQTKKANIEEEELFLADILPALESQPDEQMMEELIWDEINLSLDLLPNEQRTVFEMHELEGLSFQEISERTGEKVNTLISRKRYAVTFLKQQLNELFEIINS